MLSLEAEQPDQVPVERVYAWCFYWSSIIMIFIGLVCLAAYAALAQNGERDRGHAQFHDFYLSWCQPGKGKPCSQSESCCSARRKLNGLPTGDCYPTKFRPNPTRRTEWIAKLEPEDRKWFGGQEWIEVPDDRVIREKNPDLTGQDGHLCVGSTVLCAVPPTGAL